MIHRRRFIQMSAASAALSGSLSPAAAAYAGLGTFLAEAWPPAKAAGVSREIFDRETAGLSPDPAILARPSSQGEFQLSPKDYLSRLVNESRAAQGRARMESASAPLAQAQRAYHVPPEMVVSLWSLESGFGTAQGKSDILRSLATLAIQNERRDLFRDEFVAALVIIARGEATRAQLVGSWAGAMGQPQFMPSSYLKYAVRLSGDGAPDIWSSRDDSLASIANFLHVSGWRAGLPAVIEAKLPADFDWKPTDLDLAEWRSRGLARIGGGALPGTGAANLFLPAGAGGPVLLVTDNFEAIRAYNTSDAYALAAFVLAEKIAGRPGLVAAWPREGSPLNSSGRRALQQGLAERRFYSGAVDGKFGRATRIAVHAFQLAEGLLPADGLATQDILARLRRN